MTSLVKNLGGAAGFGEFSLARNDDGSTPFINLQSIFGTQGINFFGQYYTGLYLNNNGSVTFNAAASSFTPTAITGATANPIIAAYWSDIDTRGGAVTPSAGGTSTGTNLLWYDLDATTNTFTATWDDVGYYNGQTNKLNAFQLSIRQINDRGDFDITFRYENIDWTTGGASGGTNGLGGTPARAGYSSGNGVDYFELPQSGNQAGLLDLESVSNIGVAGTFVFQVRNGAPVIAITMGDATIVEGNSPGSRLVTIPVFLTEPSSSAITVRYATANGTAVAGQDYVAQSGTITFAPGVTQQTITVAIIGDLAIEGDETFSIVLSAPSAGVSIRDDRGLVTIRNDDSSTPGALLSIAATSADKAEGQAGSVPFTFTVTRSGNTSGVASAGWSVTGAGVNGADFAGGVLPSGIVSFAAGETSKVVSIGVAGDTSVEANEVFSVTLSNPSAGTALGTASANGVIRNDDASLSIVATSADKAEGQPGTVPFTFTVTRTGNTSGVASARWSVSGAAVNGADFAGGVLPSGTVTFAAGETSKVITVGVAGDMLVEANEAFSVTLSNPSAGTVLGTASANGVIRDDDTVMSIAAASADKVEGQSGVVPFTFTVTRTGDMSRTASARWAVTGSQVRDADFVPMGDLPNVLPLDILDTVNLLSEIVSSFNDPGASLWDGQMPYGTVNFAAGESSKTITVWVMGETVLEGDESFVVTLSNASPGYVIRTATAAGTIRTDDGPGTVRSDVSSTLGEGRANLVLTGAADITGQGNGLDNQLIGNPGDNLLLGGAGNDTLLGGSGNDVLDGGSGLDLADYSDKTGAVSVTLAGAAAAAVTIGGVVEDTVRNIENVRGGSGNDTLVGDTLSNSLFGGDGGDSLVGGAGNDTLVGGLGRDSLAGGTGADIFRFGANDSTVAAFDRIFDFTTGVDKMDIGISPAGPLASAYAEIAVASDDIAVLKRAAEARMSSTVQAVFVASATNGWLFWNTDANPVTAEQAVVMYGRNSLASFGAGDLSNVVGI